MFFLKKQKKDKDLCVIDIGSGTVAGALVYESLDSKPVMHFSFRSKIKEAIPSANYERYFLSMILSLEEVVKKMSQNLKNPPSEIIVYLRSPWLASASRIIKKQDNKIFLLNNGFLKKVVSEDNQEFIKELLDVGIEHDGHEIIEQRIEGIKINGYEVKEMPEKIKARSVEIKTFITVSPTEVLSAIENAVKLHFSSAIRFSSFSRSLCGLSKQFFPDLEDYVLFDVGALVTEISVIRNCQVVETITFPQGYEHLNQFIKTKSVISKELIEASALGHVQKNLDFKIQNLIKEVKTKWVDEISKALDKFSTQLSIPSTLILLTEDPNKLFFANLLKDESFAQYLITDKKFNVIIINTSAFENVCSVDDCKPDALLMAEALDIKNKEYA